MLFSALFLAACTGTSDPLDSSASPDTGPSRWMPSYEAPELAAQWSSDQAIAALEEALITAVPAPFGMTRTFDHFLSQGNNWCPGDFTVMNMEALEGCAANGWYYLGIGGYSLYEDDTAGGLRQSLYMLGDLEMVGPGEVLSVGGHWDHVLEHSEQEDHFTGALTGSWASPSSTDEPWLAAGLSAWLTYEGQVETTTRTRTHLRLQGGLSIGQISLHFQDLRWDSEACPSEPQGVVSWLDPGGGWWALTLSDCDGCGRLDHEGSPVSERTCTVLAGYGDDFAAQMAP